MLLKRVSMSGFKSFAEKVDFDFAAGVTCIVGPNGCGKSNVVDAFKWVLGEQSARSLRGRQMLDMIFNGSSGRKSSGMAQVDLVFDNTDRSLPIDRDEVTITRKLFRSGESEYSVCKEPSRLRDIRELFLDTGVGSNSYAVIEQGRVEALLHSSATDRRAIFEEAAGISKYRARKREAERKLDRTEQNLLRLADIVEEVEKRLRSVKLQAGKARNYQQYDERLRELRASFAMSEYHRLTEKAAEIQVGVDKATDESKRLRTDIDQHEVEATKLSRESEARAEEIAANDNLLVTIQSNVSGTKERIGAAEHRIEEQNANLERSKARLIQETQRFDQQQTEIKGVEQQVEALQSETDEQNKAIDEQSHREQDLARRITQASASVEDEKAGVVELLRRTTQLGNEITSLANHSDTLSGQKGRLSQRVSVIHSELQGIVERRSELKQKLVEVDELIEIETKRLNEKREAARVSDANSVRLAESLADQKETRSALRSRQQILDDLQKKMEGVGAGARQILDRKLLGDESDPFHSVLGLVADLFETDVHRAHIVEAAIGEHDQHLVVSDGQALLSAPDLFSDLKERTTLLCLDRLQPVLNVGDFSDQPGFVASAIDFVRYEPSLELLARNLLGKTIVVDTLQNAIAMTKEEHASGHRFVTLRGEVVESDGRVRIGPPGSHAGLISRISELRSIGEQLTVIDERVEEVSADLNRSSAQAAHLERVQQELRSAVHQMQTARVETTAGIENCDEGIRRLSSEQPLIAHEVAAIENEIAEAVLKSSQSQATLSSLEADSETREAQVRIHQESVDRLTNERREVVEKLTNAKVAAGQLLEKRAAAVETVSALRRSIRTAQEGMEAAEHEISDAKSRISDSQEAISSAREQLVELEAERESTENTGRELREKRDTLRLKIEELVDATKQLRQDLESVEARLNEQKLKLHESGVRRDELILRVREELKLDVAALYESYEHADQDWSAVEEEIAGLRQKIERLGNINHEAIVEQQELEERQVFLTTQRDDLYIARKQLDSLIEELNEQCITRFIEAFEVIRENFRELFRKLFGGGKAEIILEDPEDVLECGIEIMARPPGKELQSITLMSGGEKSMTAIALLMSIFRSRPSPFAILDEVDAALDEANNERFNGIVREFLDKSQFIIITHSKRTMGIADQMYGVTMQEPGVSTRVSVKFEQVDESGAIAVA
ncbi:MAG: chromosome segregation protein SMC [Planctomycetes bacterium]|nr:chromosome segregation protein SMC [Planctomycetota bacterium]